MVRTKQKEQLFNNKVVDSFYKNNEIYTLEQQADNLWVVRKSNKTISITSLEEVARSRFEKEKPILKGGEEQMSGLEAARETANKLKAEKIEVEEKKEVAKAEVKNQLAALQDNADLAAMYNQDAGIGAENLSGNAPYLKVHAAGKSTTNFLADGKKPNDGWFFYKPTQEQFEELTVHILTISEGFRAEGMNEDKDGNKEMVFNQVIGGYIKEGYKPFIMFLTGTKLNKMWEFGKEANRWTRAKPVKVPMFALTVKLTTVEAKTKYGASWVINFEIQKDETGFPQLIHDMGEYQFLKDSVESTEDAIRGLIAQKTKGKDVEEEPIEPIRPAASIVEEDDTIAMQDAQIVNGGIEISPEEIPF